MQSVSYKSNVQLTNAELMNRFYRGDHGAFDVLAQRLQPSLMGQAIGRIPKHLVGRYQLAEDLVQQTFFKAAGTKDRPAARWQLARGAVSTWLGTILRNALTSYLRSPQSRACVSTDLWSEQQDEFQERPENQLIDHRLQAEVETRDKEDRHRRWLAIVGKLPTELGSMVELQLQGKSHREIARRLGMARSTVTYRIKHATAALRSMVAA